MGMPEKIKHQRQLLGLTQEELAQKLGLQKSAIAKYENGRVENIKRTTILKMSEIFNCSPSFLLDVNDGFQQEIKAVRIPVLGRVAAGIPFDAIEEIVDYEEIPEAMAREGEYFGLRIKGDSMEPKISNGDIVIVRKQDDADDGDIVIALVNGNEGCCKRLRKYDNGIALVSTNPAYDPMYFSGKEVDDIPVKIVGIVRELRAKFR